MTPLQPLTHDTLRVAVGELSRDDRRLAEIVERHGSPPLWDRPPGFPTLVHIILEQQVSLASAAALFARLQRGLGGAVTPEGVVAIGRDGLRNRGLTRQKASYVASLADHVVRGELSLPGLALLPDAEAAERLTRLPGIGPWSASIYLLMALLRPDVWPPGDLALDRCVIRLQGGEVRLDRAEVRAAADRWRPWRAVAARILWHGYLSERGRSSTTPRV